jgi:hypothetical protein
LSLHERFVFELPMCHEDLLEFRVKRKPLDSASIERRVQMKQANWNLYRDLA